MDIEGGQKLFFLHRMIDIKGKDNIIELIIKRTWEASPIKLKNNI